MGSHGHDDNHDNVRVSTTQDKMTVGVMQKHLNIRMQMPRSSMLLMLYSLVSVIVGPVDGMHADEAGVNDFVLGTTGHGMVQYAANVDQVLITSNTPPFDDSFLPPTDNDSDNDNDDQSTRSNEASCHIAARKTQDGSLLWRRDACSSTRATTTSAYRHAVATVGSTVVTLDDAGALRGWTTGDDSGGGGGALLFDSRLDATALVKEADLPPRLQPLPNTWNNKHNNNDDDDEKQNDGMSDLVAAVLPREVGGEGISFHSLTPSTNHRYNPDALSITIQDKDDHEPPMPFLSAQHILLMAGLHKKDATQRPRIVTVARLAPTRILVVASWSAQTSTKATGSGSMADVEVPLSSLVMLSLSLQSTTTTSDQPLCKLTVRKDQPGTVTTLSTSSGNRPSTILLSTVKILPVNPTAAVLCAVSSEGDTLWTFDWHVSSPRRRLEGTKTSLQKPSMPKSNPSTVTLQVLHIPLGLLQLVATTTKEGEHMTSKLLKLDTTGGGEKEDGVMTTVVSEWHPMLPWKHQGALLSATLQTTTENGNAAVILSHVSTAATGQEEDQYPMATTTWTQQHDKKWTQTNLTEDNHHDSTFTPLDLHPSKYGQIHTLTTLSEESLLLLSTLGGTTIMVQPSPPSTTTTIDLKKKTKNVKASLLWLAEEGLGEIGNVVLVDVPHHGQHLDLEEEKDEEKEEVEENVIPSLQTRLQMQFEEVQEFFSSFSLLFGGGGSSSGGSSSSSQEREESTSRIKSLAAAKARDVGFGFAKIAVAISRSAGGRRRRGSSSSSWDCQSKLFGMNTLAGGEVVWSVLLPRGARRHVLVHSQVREGATAGGGGGAAAGGGGKEEEEEEESVDVKGSEGEGVRQVHHHHHHHAANEVLVVSDFTCPSSSSSSNHVDQDCHVQWMCVDGVTGTILDQGAVYGVADIVQVSTVRLPPPPPGPHAPVCRQHALLLTKTNPSQKSDSTTTMTTARLVPETEWGSQSVTAAMTIRGGYYMHHVQIQQGILRSYRILPPSASSRLGFSTTAVGEATFNPQNEEIIGVHYGNREEVVQSPATALGDDSLLIKYLNPNMAVVVTRATEGFLQRSVKALEEEEEKATSSASLPYFAALAGGGRISGEGASATSGGKKPMGATPKGADQSQSSSAAAQGSSTADVTKTSLNSRVPSLFINLVDTVSGRILHRVSHAGVDDITSDAPSQDQLSSSVPVVISENWVIYSYWSSRAKRSEVGVLTLHEGMIDKHGITAFRSPEQDVTFSSFESPRPIVLHRTYGLGKRVTALGVTQTARGITGKHLLLAMANDQVATLDRRLLDPRRPSGELKESEKVEGLVRYTPLLPIFPQRTVSYHLSVEGVRSIKSAAAQVESQSLLLAYGGPDVFFARMAPSKGFDLLPDSFNRGLLSIVVVALLTVLVVLQRMSRAKLLRIIWS